jgi:hypothetical protein
MAPALTNAAKKIAVWPLHMPLSAFWFFGSVLWLRSLWRDQASACSSMGIITASSMGLQGLPAYYSAPGSGATGDGIEWKSMACAGAKVHFSVFWLVFSSGPY